MQIVRGVDGYESSLGMHGIKIVEDFWSTWVNQKSKPMILASVGRLERE